MTLPAIDPTQMDGLARAEGFIERISTADYDLMQRLNVEMLAAARLQGLVIEHMRAVYGLKPEDRIEDDGRITRAMGAS